MVLHGLRKSTAWAEMVQRGIHPDTAELLVTHAECYGFAHSGPADVRLSPDANTFTVYMRP